MRWQKITLFHINNQGQVFVNKTLFTKYEMQWFLEQLLQLLKNKVLSNELLIISFFIFFHRFEFD